MQAPGVADVISCLPLCKCKCLCLGSKEGDTVLFYVTPFSNFQNILLFEESIQSTITGDYKMFEFIIEYLEYIYILYFLRYIFTYE